MLRLGLVTLVVADYDAALHFFVDAVGMTVVEDTDRGDGTRWIVVSPNGASGGGADLLLARASTPAQRDRVGDQTGGRVGFFLTTDDFATQHARMVAAGVRFRGEPRHEAYGTVAVFEDLMGNGWDLIQPA